MKNRNKLIMSGLLALTLGLGVSSATFAYQGDYTKKGPNYSQEFESEMTRVMLNNDYDGWRNLVENKVGRVDELITRENGCPKKHSHILKPSPTPQISL